MDEGFSVLNIQTNPGHPARLDWTVQGRLPKHGHLHWRHFPKYGERQHCEEFKEHLNLWFVFFTKLAEFEQFSVVCRDPGSPSQNGFMNLLHHPLTFGEPGSLGSWEVSFQLKLLKSWMFRFVCCCSDSLKCCAVFWKRAPWGCKLFPSENQKISRILHPWKLTNLPLEKWCFWTETFPICNGPRNFPEVWEFKS